MGLFEDCLLQYEELDAAFFQRLSGEPKLDLFGAAAISQCAEWTIHP